VYRKNNQQFNFPVVDIYPKNVLPGGSTCRNVVWVAQPTSKKPLPYLRPNSTVFATLFMIIQKFDSLFFTVAAEGYRSFF